MRWSPILNAVLASAYASAVVLFMQFIQTLRHNTPDTFLDGLGAVSLLVFSAAVMSFLFFYQPVAMLVEGKRREAISYFLKTLVTFGVITVIVLILVSLQ